LKAHALDTPENIAHFAAKDVDALDGMENHSFWTWKIGESVILLSDIFKN